MNAIAVELSTSTPPPKLYFDMTGETFDFQTSAKTGDGVFRFQWTLGSGKKGPPEHVHDSESETFAVVSGTLRIWIDGKAHDIGPGERITVQRGVRHRFLNPGKETVVVDVSLDGTLMEDALVPLAVYANGRRKMKLKDVLVMFAHNDQRASRPAGRVGIAIVSGITRLARLFGGKALPPAPGW